MNRRSLEPVFDSDNPEWTDADFDRARLPEEALSPAVLSAFTNKGRFEKASTSDRRPEEIMPDLATQFHQAMYTIYLRAKTEAKYNATLFLGMLEARGGLSTAKYLINSPKVSDGYTALYERGRLDLTVEAMLVENSQWHSLFTPDELARARKRLTDYRYQPASAGKP